MKLSRPEQMNFSYKKHLLFSGIFLMLTFFAIDGFGNVDHPKIPEKSKKPGASFIKRAADYTTEGFIENAGQLLDADHKQVPFVLFYTESRSCHLYLTEKGLTYVQYKIEKEEKGNEGEKREEPMRGEIERTDLTLKGGLILRKNIRATGAYEGHSNYFDAAYPNGIYGVKKFTQLEIKNVYPGIDWILYNSNAEGFKYDFVVHPGADASLVRMLYTSSKAVTLDASGQLLVQGRLDPLIEHAPVTYYKESGRSVNSAYKILSVSKAGRTVNTEVGFELGGGMQPLSETLVIDPKLTWSTLFGGAFHDGLQSLEIDATGNVFVAGYHGSATFPTFNAGTYYEGTLNTYVCGTIMKFNNAGTMLWATNYNNLFKGFESIALTQAGEVYVCGSTDVSTFAIQSSSGYTQTFAGNVDACIIRFDNSGNRLWATCFGGSNVDEGFSVITDKNDNVYITGTTTSSNIPLQNAGGFYQSSLVNTQTHAFIAKFDASNTLLWSSYMNGIKKSFGVCDNNGNLFLTGQATSDYTSLLNPGGGAYYDNNAGTGMEGFITKFSPGTNVLWSTFFGGGSSDYSFSIETDPSNNLIVGGYTNSSGFPVLNGGGYFMAPPASVLQQHAFLSKFNNSGTMLWSTCLGGTRTEMVGSWDNICADSCGNIYFGYETLSRNITTVVACDGGYFDGSFDSTSVTSINGQWYDAVITRFTPSGQLNWSTYFGGNGYDSRSAIEIDRKGNLYVVGEATDQMTPIVASTYTWISPGGTAYLDSTHNGADDSYILKFATGAAASFSYNAICAGSSMANPLLSAGFPTNGSFSASPGLSVNPVSGQLTLTGVNPGTYTVSFNYSSPGFSCNCYIPSALRTIIQVQPAAGLTVSGPVITCAGSPVSQTVSGAQSYSWSTGSTSNTVLLTPAVTTTYVVTGTTSAGCIVSKHVVISVSTCTGLDEELNDLSRLTIFPNPNHGSFFIRSATEAEAELFDENGRLVAGISLTNANGLKAEVKDLPAGIYFFIEKGKRENARKVVVE